MSKRFHSNSGISQRQRRVGELLRRTLAELFSNRALKGLEIPDVSVTVSEVQISPDLRKATVFVLPLGGDRAAEIVSGLNKGKNEIRKCLNQNVYLKYSPDLRFVQDKMFDQIEHMQRLFKQESSKGNDIGEHSNRED